MLMMDRIYEGADLVLAAVHGSNADAGLPRVKPHLFPLRAAKRREYIDEKVGILSAQQAYRMLC
jgi:hypothetical protein